MNQKKHLNAIAALEASKDAEPGARWNGEFCKTITCDKCYADTGNPRSACEMRSVASIRSDFESGLDAYHKRKAEKAERRAAEAAIPFPRDPDAETKPLIPDPPDTPEVRALMEQLAASDFATETCHWFSCAGCPFDGQECASTIENRQARHAFALSWLSRHPAKWDAEKGRFTLAERHARMRKWAEAVITHYPIPDEDAATVWQSGMMDSRLLADEVIAYLDEEARRRGYTK